MTLDEIKAKLSAAAKRWWPNAAKASDLPFPEYWKKSAEWLEFHAPHVGDELMGRLVRGVVEIAAEAERNGETPVANKVPDEVRETWEMAAERSSAARSRKAWEHAAERAAEVRGRFAARRGRAQQMRLRERYGGVAEGAVNAGSSADKSGFGQKQMQQER